MKLSISIIILTHNCEDVITDNLKSLISQKFPANYEVILIDDHSKDQTVVKVKEFITGKNRFKLVQQNINRGNGYCKNLGLKLAKGEIVFFLDDHLYLRDKTTILKMYDYLGQNSNIIGVCGNYISATTKDYNICRDIRRFMVYNKNKENIIMSKKNFMPFSIVISALNKKNIKKSAGSIFPEDFKKNAAEDIFFQLKQHELGGEFAYVSHVIGIHSHNLNFKNLLIKSKRELSGFSYIVEKKINNDYFKTIYFPYFFSFPLLIWLSLFVNLFMPWMVIFTVLLLIPEFIILWPIFKFKAGLIVKIKTFIYCFSNELIKIFFIVKIIIKKPSSAISIASLLTKWEVKKYIYIYENRLKKPGTHKTAIAEQRS